MLEIRQYLISLPTAVQYELIGDRVSPADSRGVQCQVHDPSQQRTQRTDDGMRRQPDGGANKGQLVEGAVR